MSATSPNYGIVYPTPTTKFKDLGRELGEMVQSIDMVLATFDFNGDDPGAYVARVIALETLTSQLRRGHLKAASAAARAALFPAPVQGDTVLRTDKGWTEAYFATYNASTNPGGATPAGWYPLSGALPFGVRVRSAAAASIQTSVYTNLSATGLWTHSTAESVNMQTAQYSDGWIIPFPGVWEISATVMSNAANAVLCGFSTTAGAVTHPAHMEGAQSAASVATWCQNSPKLCRRFAAGDKVRIWALAGGSIASVDTAASTRFSARYIGPPVGPAL